MAQKILFINCSGVITSCELVDKVENLAFSRNAIGALIKISENTDFKIKLFARENKLSNAVLTKIIDTLVAESVDVDSIYTINELAQLATDADLSNSSIVSNCFDDFSLVSCGKILFATAGEGCNMVSDNWLSIAEFLTFPPRKAVIKRKTNETDIFIDLNLDGSGKSEIATGLHFFDHMLEQLARHSNCDMVIKVNGDLQVDEHHTMEDTAIALGEAFLKALGDKKRIERYGFLLPMDDCLAQAAIDFSGRPWLVWNAEFNREMIGDTPTEMFYHFFKSFSDSSKCNLNIKVEGTNEHHKIEAIFKATAKSIKQAVSRSLSNKGLPSTKGLL